MSSAAPGSGPARPRADDTTNDPSGTLPADRLSAQPMPYDEPLPFDDLAAGNGLGEPGPGDPGPGNAGPANHATGNSGPGEPHLLGGEGQDPADEPVGARVSTDVPLATAPDPRAAAFFDVDNTLMRGASLFYLARGLHSRRFFSTGEIVTAGWRQLKFRVVGSEDPEHVREVREQALAFISGWPVAELLELSEEIFDEVLTTKIWPGTREMAQRHLDHGERVWLVTAAPVEIARLIAERLGLTGALGTVAETVDGYYTGRLVGDLLHGAAKADAVLRLATEERLNLALCSAYSDSANDVPMLSLVGQPYAINPDRRLRNHARARGWRIRDFRRARRAARLGLAGAAFAGAVGGATAAGVALRKNSLRKLQKSVGR